MSHRKTTGREDELRKVTEELEEKNRQIKMFAISVIHDLKSPAIGVHGLAKRLSKMYQTNDDQATRSYCQQIMQGAEQIVRLLDEIGVYIKASGALPKLKLVRLQDIIAVVRDEFSPWFLLRNIRFCGPGEDPKFKADEAGLIRVLRNLVGNALKYGGEKLDKIEVGYEETSEFRIISVADDGVGIKIDNPAQIFLPFQRHKTARGIEGSGLGLAIVKEIAQRHRGNAWFESRDKGGTVFFVSIAKKI